MVFMERKRNRGSDMVLKMVFVVLLGVLAGEIWSCNRALDTLHKQLYMLTIYEIDPADSCSNYADGQEIPCWGLERWRI